MQRRRMFALAAVSVVVLGRARPAPAQELTWRNGVTFYADNTEFFNPYRTGETLLGGQVLSYLSAALGPRTEVIAGFFGNHQSGGTGFFDPFKPILGFRYRTDHSLGVIGTLVTEDRHGYLEPLEGTLLDIVRPVEYGVQWREQHTAGGGEIFLNWQRLNTARSREIFDYGLLLHADPARWLRLELQGHGLHHGGQLYTAGEPVANNEVLALGAQVSGKLPVAGASSLRVFQLMSHGDIDYCCPAGRTTGTGPTSGPRSPPGTGCSCSPSSGGGTTTSPTRVMRTTTRRARTPRSTARTDSIRRSGCSGGRRSSPA